jgi:hypothetical protein
MDGTLHIALTGFVAPIENKMSNTLDTNKGGRMPRRYKPVRKPRRIRVFKPMTLQTIESQQQPTSGSRVKYPSHVGAVINHALTGYDANDRDNRDGQKNNLFTVSIPYNKGAYQVIPDGDIEHIGR